MAICKQIAILARSTLPLRGLSKSSFEKTFLLGDPKGEPLPEAVGDNVPKGGRSGEAKPRTGGPAWSPPGRSVGGPAKPEQAPTPCHRDGSKEALEIIEREDF